MSFPNYYFVGGEDIDFLAVGPGLSIGTAPGTFRSGFSRCALVANNSPGLNYWRSYKPFSLSAFWTGTWTFVGGPNPNASYFHWGLMDAGGVARIQIWGNNSGGFTVYKVNALGAATTLGTFAYPFSGALDKLDFQISYATSGFLNIYISPGGVNGRLIFSYTGDVTTDGQTLLAYEMLGCGVAGNSGISTYWSEVIVSDSDTRSMNLYTEPPVANGNTHNFDVGSPAASNVNEIIVDDSTLDGASAAGLIDQYTIPAIPTGAYAVAAFAVSARLMRGFAGPSKMDLGVRSAGADYWGPDEVLNGSFTSGYQEIWNTDPATSAAWAGIPTNIGLKAVA